MLLEISPRRNISGRTGINFQPTYAAASNHHETCLAARRLMTPTATTNNDFHGSCLGLGRERPSLDSATTITQRTINHRVEQATSGAYTQLLCAPRTSSRCSTALLGSKESSRPSAVARRQCTLRRGLAYYSPSDWLGSSRLASTPSAPSITMGPTPPSARTMPNPAPLTATSLARTRTPPPTCTTSLPRIPPNPGRRVPNPATASAPSTSRTRRAGTGMRLSARGSLNSIDRLGLFDVTTVHLKGPACTSAQDHRAQN